MKLDEYLKDYKSLYPSIVKTFKLSNESIVGIINKKQLITLCSIAKAFKIDDLSYVFKEILPKYLSYDPEVMYAVEHYEQTDKYDKKFDIKNISNGFKIDIEYYPLYDNGVFQNKFENLKEFISWLKDNNFALMPNGVVVDQNREDAIIAKIIADLMNARDKYKKMMLECRKNGDYDGEATYDTYQTAVKVVNNSCFTKDHSVLTLDGVKPINDVKIGDKLYSFNIETRKTEIDTVIDTIEKDYNGELYHINTKVGKVDFNVTNDHKLVLEDTNGNIVIKTAEELFNEYDALPLNSRKLLYSFPLMHNGNNMDDVENHKIFIHDFILNKYSIDELKKTYIYIIPKKPVYDLRTFFIHELNNIFDRKTIKSTTCSFGINRSVYKICVLDITDEQLQYLKDHDHELFDCYYKKLTNTRVSGITPFSFFRNDINTYIGWLMSEGGMSKGTERKQYDTTIKGVSKSISIYQYKNIHPEYYDEIYQLLKHMRFTNIRSSFGGHAISNTIFYDWIDDITKHKSDVPDFIYNGSNIDKQLFITSLIKGDGHKYSDKHRGLYTTINPILKDKLLNILLSMGYQTRCHCEKIEGRKVGYRISYMHRKISIFKKDLTKTTFNGKVYCLVVEKNHNFFAGNTATGSFRLTHNCYGVLALEKFRMFDAKIADAITTTGQLLIRSTIHLTNKYLNSVSNTENEDYVLTTDTDSVIFTLRGITDEPTTTRDPIKLAQIAEYSKQCQNYINESVYDICKNMFYKYKISKTNNFLTIKNEWLASAGLFVAKKMYVIYMVFNEGIPKEKLKPTGISLKRSSTPAILKPFLEKVINEILSYKTNSEVDTLIIEECEKLKNEYSISDIAIPISLHDLDSYDRIPIHVRGINMWNDYFAPLERDKVNSGKVKYFYVKSWDNNKLNLDKEYVLSVPNVDSCWSLIEGKVTVDYDKMKERLILKPIDAFYSALGWKLPKQTTISHNNIFSDLF